MTYDVIIVGARCAGATLGAYLARAGVRTLMVEAMSAFSDNPMSTHFLQPPGMVILDELGIGDAVRAVTPAAPSLRFGVEGHYACVTQPLPRAGCCPRRVTLDPLLQRAAIAAGAELRDRTRVVDLVRNGERVTGVVVEGPAGRETLHSKWVVGADGRHSTIARLTGVEEYLKVPMSRSAFWHYRTQPDLWRTDDRYTGFQAHIDYLGTGIRAAFRCDSDTMVMVSLVPNDEAQEWKGDLMDRSVAYLSECPVMPPLLAASEPITRVRSLVKADFFYRRPVGPGFALVGDAGTFKDFATGMGIASAMIAARQLSKAILDGRESAFLRYWRERDVESLPLYFDSLRLGETGVNDAFFKLLAENLERSPALCAKLAAVSARTLSPLDAFTTGELLRMVIPAVLRGRFDVLPAFLKTGRKIAGYKREVAYRERLLRELDPQPEPPSAIPGRPDEARGF
jgi:flavin-dependent dehydrogenase